MTSQAEETAHPMHDVKTPIKVDARQVQMRMAEYASIAPAVSRCAWCPEGLTSPGTDFCSPECAQAFEWAELIDLGMRLTGYGHPSF